MTLYPVVSVPFSSLPVSRLRRSWKGEPDALEGGGDVEELRGRGGRERELLDNQKGRVRHERRGGSDGRAS
jgi:hypothetical protein